MLRRRIDVQKFVLLLGYTLLFLWWLSHVRHRTIFIIDFKTSSFFLESAMGNSLHNKIYLGRRRVDRIRMAWAGLVAGVGLLWLTVKALK